MNNNSQNDGILPPKAPNTRQSGEYSPEIQLDGFEKIAGSIRHFSDNPNADISNTCQSSEPLIDLKLNLFNTLFPYVNLSDGVDIGLSDAHGFIVDRVMGQVQTLQDLFSKIEYSEDLDGQALAFTAESINRQLAVLNSIHNEYYKLTRGKKAQYEKAIEELEQHKKELSECERVIRGQSTKITELERTIIIMKGGAV